MNTEIWNSLLVLRIEKRHKGKGHYQKYAYCYCTEYNRFGWTKYTSSKTGPVAKSGVKFPIRTLKECNYDIITYTEQWKWIPTYDNKYERSFINGKTVRKHRFIMETILDRNLSKSEIIDHIDGNGKNNSLKNLRLVNLDQKEQSIQHINVSRRPTSSGYRYIYLEGKNKDRFKVQIGKNYVGCRWTIEEAVNLRNTWLEENDPQRLKVMEDRFLV